MAIPSKSEIGKSNDAGVSISIIGGIKASASDFVFSYSIQEYLNSDELDI